MLSTEQKVRRGFHWLAAILAAILLSVGLALLTFDVSDFWHGGKGDTPVGIGDLLLGAIGLFFACGVLLAAVRALGRMVRLYRRYEADTWNAAFAPQRAARQSSR